jgi:hypothetical protein
MISKYQTKKINEKMKSHEWKNEKNISYHLLSSCFCCCYRPLPSLLSVILIAAVIVRMMMVVVKNTVRYDNVQVVRLVRVMIVCVIVPLLLVLPMLPLPLSCGLSLLGHHQVRWIMTVGMFLNRRLGMLRGHHQEGQLTRRRKSPLVLLKYLLRIQNTPILRIPRLSPWMMPLNIRMVNSVTPSILITVHDIQLLIVVKIYLDYLVLVKPCLCLDHVVPIVVVALL